MTNRLRLHYAPDNASLCVRLALDSVGASFDTVLVDRAARGQKSPRFLALNPNGLIPVLETPDGVLFETGAILQWLSDHHAGLLPDSGADRAAALKWLFWLSNTLHPNLRMLFYPDHFTSGDADALRSTTRTRINGQLAILDSAHDAPWLDAEHPGAPACYLAPMLRWLALYGGDTAWFDLARTPRLLAFARAADTWPVTALARTAEGLGPTPFSDPHLPNPPEGSAT
ncbi:glutathione S-transferase family protein [Octadecabacter sp. R77987]|uniref:glutathione S-transferase family protein n=1 Tax=Octadecabacter sp. R77987 TaxID=3093874 RepID=UPI00366D1833